MQEKQSTKQASTIKAYDETNRCCKCGGDFNSELLHLDRRLNVPGQAMGEEVLAR
jgi:hypothetical protein